MIYLNENIETLDVRTALATVSEQRRQKVLQYRQIHDQRQSLAVYLLLCEALGCDIETVPDHLDISKQQNDSQ